jgi:hypothetical protein
MISAGATPKTVQAVLGHASAAFTLTVYGHPLMMILTISPTASKT